MENYCGKRLDGRYEIREIIGVGGMSVVYKAYDNIDDRIVAVKILKEEFLSSEESRRRFKNESKAIAVLSHPNIVKVYDVSFGDRIQYIVMEYVEGITLKEYIEQQKVVNWKEAVHFVSQILLALQHAHDKGIVHRDIKPQNIMLLQDGTIKVADFGIARFSRDGTKTMTEDAIGSVHYISPEQARGELTDDKADIYSMGVVMYEMLTGQLPFQSDNAVSIAIMQLQQEAVPPREINPDIPLGLEQITMRAMQKNPNNRYHSAAEMMLDIDEFKRNPSIKFNYNYFVDKEPTKYVDSKQPTQTVPAVETGEGKLNLTKEEIDEMEPSKTMPILFGIIAGIIVILGIFVGVLVYRNTHKISVPNFVGLNYADEVATKEDYTDNFNFETVSIYSDEAEAGVILSQDPLPETKVKKGKTIKLEIAYNDDSILITGIIGLTSSEAEEKLKQNGFDVKVITTYNKNEKTGYVFEVNPSENSYAEKGSLVTIYVASDENPNAVKVPDVAGYSRDIAIQLLKSSGFNVSVSTTDSDKPEGTVVDQSPKANEDADSGSTVTIYVSTGIPSESTATIDITLPSTTGSSTGVMKVYLDNELYKTYDEVLLNGSKKTIEITGKGEKSFAVTVNDQTILKGNINFTVSPAVVTNSETVAYVEKLPVPNVAGKSVSEALTILKNAGFTNVVVVDSNNNPASSGTVTSQDPVADSTQYATNTQIRLKVEIEQETPNENNGN
jgi:serine/threonine-protein kinase